jgi:mRNA interferase MazF
MRRGDVWWMSLAANAGSELKKPRPVVVVSNNVAIQVTNHVQIVPLSSKIEKLYPCDIMVTVTGMELKAMADHIMTVNKERLSTCLGPLSPDELQGLDMVLRNHLGLA